jgi:hypothetical protein
MTKKVVFSVFSVVALLLLAVLPASADLPGGGWWGGIQVANLGTAPADIEVSVDTGTDVYTASELNVPPGGSANFLTPQIGPAGSSWRGAAIVSSNQPIAAVATETNKENTALGVGEAGGSGRALYPGVNNPDTTVFFPLVKNNHVGKYTSFFVQNAGATAATFYATFVDLGGTEFAHEYANIEPGEMTLIDPADAGFPSGTGVGVGSLTVTSTVPLAGVVNEYKDPGAGNPALDLMATRGFAPADASDRLLFPIFKNNFVSKHVGIQIQNTGDAAAAVDLTATETFCFAGGEQVRTASQTIAPGASYTFLGPDIIGDGCLAAVEVTADQPIVGAANESRLYTSQFTVYFGFDANAATENVFAPLYKQLFVDGNTSGLQVQNTSATADATCTLTWTEVYPTAGATYTYNDTIPMGQSKTYYRMDNTTDYPDANWGASGRPPNGSNQAVGVVCSESAVGVVQEANQVPANQDAGNYEAFNQ